MAGCDYTLLCRIDDAGVWTCVYRECEGWEWRRPSGTSTKQDSFCVPIPHCSYKKYVGSLSYIKCVILFVQFLETYRFNSN